MDKFKVKCNSRPSYYISDGGGNYMHRDGEIVHSHVEYWPTKEQAQAVLDKFQPKHVWKHGDVFKRKTGTVMIYVDPHENNPRVYRVDHTPYSNGTLRCLDDATFLFNIKDKL